MAELGIVGGGESEDSSVLGYETNGVVPLFGYLGVGFTVALLYATSRADRRQHRGLSLVSMAVGLAALIWSVSFFINPIATLALDESVTTEIGVLVAIVGTLIWTVGSFLLAKEPRVMSSTMSASSSASTRSSVSSPTTRPVRMSVTG